MRVLSSQTDGRKFPKMFSLDGNRKTCLSREAFEHDAVWPHIFCFSSEASWTQTDRAVLLALLGQVAEDTERLEFVLESDSSKFKHLSWQRNASSIQDREHNCSSSQSKPGLEKSNQAGQCGALLQSLLPASWDSVRAPLPLPP